MAEKETVKEENIENEAQVKEEPQKKAKKSRLKRTPKDQKLKDEIEELKIQLAESKDKHLRLFAEFDNFKKRSVKEKLEFMATAAQSTMSALLPVLDDFDRAKKAADDEASTEQFSDGVSLVFNKIHAVLEGKGLKAMESTGEVFDPELFEAITEIPAPTEELKGKVIDTVEKGYLLKEKIIRHAKVVVGK